MHQTVVLIIFFDGQRSAYRPIEEYIQPYSSYSDRSILLSSIYYLGLVNVLNILSVRIFQRPLLGVT